MEGLTEFIENATLLTLLNLLTIGLCFLVGIVMFIVARSRKAMLWFLAISFVPLVSGILTMYFKNRILDQGMGMFGRLPPEAIAEGRRDALVGAGLGATATVLILLMRALRVWLSAKNVSRV